MAGGRRSAKSSSFKHHHGSDDRQSFELPKHPKVAPPKHIPVPDMSPSSDLCFELDSLLFSVLIMSGQYINLFRTVFWLPTSDTEIALNYHLIDLNVLTLNLIMVGRKLPVCILKKLCVCLSSSAKLSDHFINIVAICILLPPLLFCVYNILFDHGVLSIVPLLYPFILYIVAFGSSFEMFLDLKCFIPDQNQSAKISAAKEGAKQCIIGHTCTMSAVAIREEVKILRDDFNFRMKQVLFNSLLIAYHAAFLPTFFAPSILIYDIYWVAQYSVLAGLSCFTFYACHCFPAKYCDILHRAAMHLGRWQRVEAKNIHIPYSVWNESSVWNQGVLVKHLKELFKAEGISNAAEPGNSSLSRFYVMFKNPSAPMKFLWIFHLLLVLFLVKVLCKSSKWNDLIPIQLLILLNCKTLYKITKVYFVIKRIYYEENSIISKFND